LHGSALVVHEEVGGLVGRELLEAWMSYRGTPQRSTLLTNL